MLISFSHEGLSVIHGDKLIESVKVIFLLPYYGYVKIPLLHKLTHIQWKANDYKNLVKFYTFELLF